jgi:hypothetical protein
MKIRDVEMTDRMRSALRHHTDAERAYTAGTP